MRKPRYRNFLTGELIPKTNFRHLLSYPLLFSFLVATPIFDVWAEIYHRICFKLYGIPYIKRSAYIAIDRQRLSKLNWLEKFGCMYCGYVNGWMLYAAAIAQATEKYWCAIIHKEKDGYKLPSYQKNFAKREKYE